MATASELDVKKSITRLITICLIPACLISTILFNYSDKILVMLYKTTTGHQLIKKYVWFFITFYFISPFNTILISRNQSNKVFIISIITHIIKLLTILILPYFSNDSLIISYIIANILIFIIDYCILHIQYKFIVKINELITIVLTTVIINCLCLIFSSFNINFIIQILIISLVYIMLLFRILRAQNK